MQPFTQEVLERLTGVSSIYRELRAETSGRKTRTAGGRDMSGVLPSRPQKSRNRSTCAEAILASLGQIEVADVCRLVFFGVVAVGAGDGQRALGRALL